MRKLLVFSAAISFAIAGSAWASVGRVSAPATSTGSSLSGFVFFLFLLMLASAHAGWMLRRLFFHRFLDRDRTVPTVVRRAVARYLGMEKLERLFDDLAISEHRLYAIHLLGAVHDLGGRFHVPRSGEAMDGILREAERRYRLDAAAWHKAPMPERKIG